MQLFVRVSICLAFLCKAFIYLYIHKNFIYMKPSPHPLKAIILVHISMLIGQVIFAAIAVFLLSQKFGTPQKIEYDRIFQLIAITLAAIGFLLGTKNFKKQIRASRDSSETPQKKFEAYRKASIILWALLEIPCLLGIVFFYLTANYAFIILAAAIIFLFAIFGPSKQKIMMYLNISESDIENLV